MGDTGLLIGAMAALFADMHDFRTEPPRDVI